MDAPTAAGGARLPSACARKGWGQGMFHRQWESRSSLQWQQQQQQKGGCVRCVVWPSRQTHLPGKCIYRAHKRDCVHSGCSSCDAWHARQCAAAAAALIGGCCCSARRWLLRPTSCPSCQLSPCSTKDMPATAVMARQTAGYSPQPSVSGSACNRAAMLPSCWCCCCCGGWTQDQL